MIGVSRNTTPRGTLLALTILLAACPGETSSTGGDLAFKPDGDGSVGPDGQAPRELGGDLADLLPASDANKLPRCVEPYPCPPGHSCDYTTLRAVDKAAADSVRKALIGHVWSGKGFPAARLPDKVETIPLAQSPVTGVENLAALARLTVTMPLTTAEGGGAFTSYAFHFKPQKRIDRLFVYHQGHSGALGPNGGDTTIRFLVKRGYDVVGLMMPLLGGNTGPPGYKNHDDMMKLESATRCPLQFFLEPVAAAIHQLQKQHAFKDVSMIGISGGGWTTTLYAAADTSVSLSFPVAGSLPLDLRDGPSKGDGEQTHPELYTKVASYRDLYVLGGAGQGRAQVQVLNRFDTCCFAGVVYRGYENRVRAVARSLGGSFDAYLDATHKSHLISTHTLETVVAPRLAKEKVWVLEERDDGHGYSGSVYGSATLSGPWSSWPAGFGGALAFAAAGAGATATWMFGHLAPGTYRVSVTWTPHQNRATNAPYVVLDGNNPVASVAVNQQLAPKSRDTMGATWEDLGQGHVITGDTLSVQLTSKADGYVIADAVRVELLKPGPPLCQ
jgi:hypothetical protein